MTNFSFFFILKKKTKHLTLRRTNWYGNLPYNIREFLWMLWGTCLIWYLEERNLSYVLHGPDEWSTKNARLLQKGKIPPKMEEPLLHWENKNLLIWNSLLECALPYQHSRFLGMSLMVFRIYLHIFVHLSQLQTHLFGQRAKTTCSSAICAQNLSWPLLNMGK